jgi:hypothetical protein
MFITFPPFVWVRFSCKRPAMAVRDDTTSPIAVYRRYLQ